MILMVLMININLTLIFSYLFFFFCFVIRVYLVSEITLDYLATDYYWYSQIIHYFLMLFITIYKQFTIINILFIIFSLPFTNILSLPHHPNAPSRAIFHSAAIFRTNIKSLYKNKLNVISRDTLDLFYIKSNLTI